MKGSLLGLRSTKLSFVLVTLVFTTLLIWGWDKAPFLVSLFPQSQLIKLSPDMFVGAPLTRTTSEPQRHVGDDLGTSASNASSDKPKEQVFDLEALSDSANGHDERRNKEDGKSSKGKEGDGLVQMDSAKSPVATRKVKGDFEYQVKNQTCNYAKGKWVSDENRPFYSGGRCRQWLSEMWACRVTNRIDFSYEKFRWQPKDCETEEFSGSKFLRRMRNKTLAFIGDSLGRQQFQSLMCMITGGKERSDVVNVGWEYGLVKARGAIRPDGWAYRFPRTNTTILFYWSACLCDLQKVNSSDPNSEIAMHLDRPPEFLTHYLQRFDVLVLNTGHHWNRGKFDQNHWVMHVGGFPDPEKNILEAKNLTIQSIVKWVDSQLPRHPKLKAFYRTISPRHFFNGDWNSGGSCDNTNPLSKGKEVLKEESSDPVAATAVEGTNVTLLDITALSELRDEGHISKYSIRPSPGMQDCLHWCLPGVPDTWNEILFSQLFPFRRRI